MTSSAKEFSLWAAVVGRPIAHSLSPNIHLAAYKKLGFAGQFKRLEFASEEEFNDFLVAWPDSLLYLCVTMPFKQLAFKCSKPGNIAAKSTEIVNTLLPRRDEDGKIKYLAGYNTDADGIKTCLQAANSWEAAAKHKTALVIGSGATSKSAIFALSQLGFTDIIIASRQVTKSGNAAFLAEKIPLNWTHLPLDDLPASLPFTPAVVIQTLPASVIDAQTDKWLKTFNAIRPGIYLDVAYDPQPRPISAEIVRQKWEIIPGTDMLVAQAACQISLALGRYVSLEVLKDSIKR